MARNTTALAVASNEKTAVLERVVVQGDLSQLQPAERVAGHPQEVVFVYWFWWGIKCLVFMCILFAGLPVWLILSIMDVFPMRWLAEKLELDLL